MLRWLVFRDITRIMRGIYLSFQIAPKFDKHQEEQSVQDS